MSWSKDQTGQRHKEDEGWFFAIILETEGYSSAVNSARCRPNHDTRYWPHPPKSCLSPIIIISIAYGGWACPPTLAPEIQKTENEFIKRFEKIVKSLPESVPIGSRNDKLAAFNIEPALLDNPETDAGDLWEVVINGFLKEHLGWGEQVNMGELIRRGEQGMDGVLRFAKYFIEKRGVSVDLFEGKLSHLLGSAESLCVKFCPLKKCL